MCGDPIDEINQSASNNENVHKGFCAEVATKGTYSKGRYILPEKYLKRMELVLKKQHEHSQRGSR